MRTSKIKIQGLTIPYLVGSDSERYWPMRPICEAMGLNWHSQAAKLHPPDTALVSMMYPCQASLL